MWKYAEVMPCAKIDFNIIYTTKEVKFSLKTWKHTKKVMKGEKLMRSR